MGISGMGIHSLVAFKCYGYTPAAQVQRRRQAQAEEIAVRRGALGIQHIFVILSGKSSKHPILQPYHLIPQLLRHHSAVDDVEGVICCAMDIHQNIRRKFVSSLHKESRLPGHGQQGILLDIHTGYEEHVLPFIPAGKDYKSVIIE